MQKKIVNIIMVFIILILPIATYAATEAELQNKKNELQNNINAAREEQKDKKEEISSARAELYKLNDEIEEKEEEIEKTTVELNGLNSEIDSLTKQINEAQKQYDDKYDLLCKRLATQYKKGKVSYLDLLLNSSTLTDFISNYHRIEKVAEMDTKLLDDIEEQKTTIETSRKKVETKRNEVQEKENQLKTDKIILTNKQSNKNKYISKLTEEEKALQRDIDKFNADMKAADRELQEIARQNAMNSGGFNYTGGKLLWPTPASKRITSTFGYRGSAATGGVGTANHNGYDIGAPNGSSIVSAESGQVIKVIRACSHNYPKTYKTKCNCGGGYGNYLMISHGNNLVTLYGHCASISVNVGDIVTRGQEIAKVGSAGWSTGYHLHFSVLLNGTYVNPGNYF